MKNNLITSYEWHSLTKPFRYMISGLCLFASIWVGFHAKTGRLSFIAVAFAFGALAVHLGQIVRIDTTAGAVSRDIIFGRCRLWSSRWSLSEFTGITAYRLSSGNPQTSSAWTEVVGFRRLKGGVLAIRYFHARRGKACPEAESFVRNLEEATQLEFRRTV